MGKVQKRTAGCRKWKPAFTVLEILLATSMLAVILGAVYGSYSAATGLVTGCKPKSVRQHQARVFLQRFTQQIRCCYAGRENESDKVPPHQGQKEALRQADAPLFFGERISSGRTFLRYVTSAVLSKQGRDLGRLTLVGYRLDKSGTVLLCGEQKSLLEDPDEQKWEWHVVFENLRTIKIE